MPAPSQRAPSGKTAKKLRRIAARLSRSDALDGEPLRGDPARPQRARQAGEVLDRVQPRRPHRPRVQRVRDDHVVAVRVARQKHACVAGKDAHPRARLTYLVVRGEERRHTHHRVGDLDAVDFREREARRGRERDARAQAGFEKALGRRVQQQGEHRQQFLGAPRISAGGRLGITIHDQVSPSGQLRHHRRGLAAMRDEENPCAVGGSAGCGNDQHGGERDAGAGQTRPCEPGSECPGAPHQERQREQPADAGANRDSAGRSQNGEQDEGSDQRAEDSSRRVPGAHATKHAADVTFANSQADEVRKGTTHEERGWPHPDQQDEQRLRSHPLGRKRGGMRQEGSSGSEGERRGCLDPAEHQNGVAALRGRGCECQVAGSETCEEEREDGGPGEQRRAEAQRRHPRRNHLESQRGCPGGGRQREHCGHGQRSDGRGRHGWCRH